MFSRSHYRSTFIAAAIALGAIAGTGTATAASAERPACTNANPKGVQHIKHCRSTYDVRVEAVKGRDPVSGTLRISCRQGFELSPVDPPGAYWISFGSLDPTAPGYTSVTRTARTPTSYEIHYRMSAELPAGAGIYLEGTCVPV